MKARAALKAATPLWIKQPIKDLLARRSVPPAFTGDYATFDAALAACGARGGYEAQAVLDHYIAGYAELREIATNRHSAPSMFRRVVPIMAALSFCEPVARVVDFGGSYGEYYHRLRYLRPGFDPVWDIVETPAVCSIAAELGASERKRFFPSLGALPAGPVSLVIASGALQYTPDPVATLRDVFAIGAPYVLLSRLPVASALARHRLVVQRASVLDGAFPVWFFARSIFDEIARYGRVLFDFTIPEDEVELDGAAFCYSGCLVRVHGVNSVV